MPKAKKKKALNLNLSLVLVVIILIVIIVILISKKASIKDLSDFERNAIYNYFENSLSIEKLYQVSGKSQYDETQYTQSKIKEAADSIYEQKHEKEIKVDEIMSELSKQDISLENIDFRAIVISDYEYSDSEKAFIRKEGANSGISGVENQIQGMFANETIVVTELKKLKKDSYSISFNIVEKYNKENIKESGIATIKIENNTYSIEKCEWK